MKAIVSTYGEILRSAPTAGSGLTITGETISASYPEAGHPAAGREAGLEDVASEGHLGAYHGHLGAYPAVYPVHPAAAGLRFRLASAFEPTVVKAEGSV